MCSGGGSAVGLGELRGGEADLAAVSWQAGRGTSCPGLQAIPVARDASPSSCIPRNTMPGPDPAATPRALSGRDAGLGAPGWPGGEPVVISREDGSGTRAAFEALVMGGDRVTLNALVMPTSQAVVDYVATHRAAIGYVSMACYRRLCAPCPVEDVPPTAPLSAPAPTTWPHALSLRASAAPPRTQAFLDFVAQPCRPGHQWRRQLIVPMRSERADQHCATCDATRTLAGYATLRHCKSSRRQYSGKWGYPHFSCCKGLIRITGSGEAGCLRSSLGMKSDLIMAVNQICAEKDLPRPVILGAIEEALVHAYRRNYANNTAVVQVSIDPDTGDLRVFCEKKVVETVQDASVEITLAEARKTRPASRDGRHGARSSASQPTSAASPRRPPNRSSCSASTRRSAMRLYDSYPPDGRRADHRHGAVH